MGELATADPSVLESMQSSMRLSDEEDEPVDDIIFVSSESNDLPSSPAVTSSAADTSSVDNSSADATNTALDSATTDSTPSSTETNSTPAHDDEIGGSSTSGVGVADSQDSSKHLESNKSPDAASESAEVVEKVLAAASADDPLDIVLVEDAAVPVVAAPSRQVVVMKQDVSSADDDLDDDFEDETLLERLAALSEMFPDSVQSGGAYLFRSSISGVKGLYSLLCSGSWLFFSSATILLAPVMFEVERCQMDEMHKQQQRQILLGPNAAVSGSGMNGPPMR